MRIIGKRQEKPITFSGSAASLIEGAQFNDEIHKLPSGSTTCIPKGVYRFKSHEAADEFLIVCIANAVAATSVERNIKFDKVNEITQLIYD